MPAHFSEYRRLETQKGDWPFLVPALFWEAGFYFIWNIPTGQEMSRGGYMGFEDTQDKETVIEPIKIGEKEYSQDELSKLVGLGETAQELQIKWNTDINKIYPEFTRKSQRLNELEKEKEAWELEKNKEEEITEDEQITKAREAAKKVGIVTDDLFDQRLDKSFRNYYLRERSAERLLDESTSLEGKYNGKDGRPKFSGEEILGYMQENGIRSPEQAYKIKYEPELDAWKEKQLKTINRGGMVTETATNAGGKLPPPLKITKENLNDLVSQAMNGEL